MRINDNVKNILGNSRIENNKLFLPDRKFDRKLYMSVNKVLSAIGGKWNRKAKAHLFNADIESIIENILLTGEYIDAKKEYQFFETPHELAQHIVDLAGIHADETVLEPSAGKGRIAELVPDCDCIELNPDNRQYLIDKGFNVVGENFLEHNERYDVIIANPPFSKQQDIDHVNHMIDLANRKVVSVMSASVMFKDNKKTVAFRERIENLGGVIEMLPEKTFSESGTNVQTCLVVVDI